MERRKALAAATAATLALGSGIVVAASLSGVSILGFGGGAPHRVALTADSKPEVTQRVVVRRRDVYDRRVVDTTSPPADLQSSIDTGEVTRPTSTATTSASEPTPTAPTTAPPVPITSPRSPSPTSPTTVDDEDPPSVSPTTQPASSSTLPTTTPTTRPRGVPSDWPPGEPIPPEPANCREARLSLSGVWHCDD